MAIGDDALAAGIPIMNGTEQANTLDTEMNKTRDEIARRTSTVMPIAKGGTGATTADGARSALGLAPIDAGISAGTLVQRDTNKTIAADRAYLALDPVLPQHATPKSYVDGAVAGKANQSSVDGIYGGNLSSDVYNRTLGGSYRVAYVNSSGVLGWVSSSRRHKKNIRAAVVDTEAVLAMQLVTFLYKVDVDRDRLGELQHGLIAEDLDAAGLDWLVDYADDGQPEGVRYDRIALALLPVVQDLAGRIAAIETHLDAIGGDLHAPTD